MEIFTNIITGKNQYFRFSILFLFILLISINYVYGQTTFEKIIKVNQKISLEDSIHSIPASITTDKEGTFISTNSRTHKVSLYDSEGNLKFKYGKRGKGPGDFLGPVYTIRLSSGELLTAEFKGKLSLFNSKGDSLVKVYNTKVLPLVEIHQVNKNKVLLVGRKIFGKKIKWLHIFDLKKGTITRSFFEPPFSIRNDYGGIFTTFPSFASATVSNGKIAATFAPFTEIHVYNSKGKSVRSVNFSLEYFKKAENINHLPPRKFDEYITTFSMIDNIFWLNNDNFLIRYYRFTRFNREDDIKEQQYSLANVKPDGTLLFEIKNAPMLRSVNGSQLYFKNRNIKSNKELVEGVIRK